ncbi:MAG: ABC transporter ATP-binding protein [Methylococcaceae bacterium]|nr:ABC transporter ATP-binding protein [Methylococcaceae bacterium]MDZ4157557.1 ABC transporter ATP-binding protein [Methylococcales bacterium]MDP2395084.1 ABC transporter ATP-binding protein [Methylococcaceae bacterium]MDP3019334.1 ABC transporter ATP-binding protein [Methylococcaceae bacterium]MDP3389085.1 ABC transporter ATP-binding protein [Methylococcaceae bacterium]
MSSDDIAIRVQNLSKCYQIYDTPRDRLKQFVAPRLQRLVGVTPRQYFNEFWALKDISFEVKKGETVGIIGRNGSGKSTLLQMICGTLHPTGGSIQTSGRIAALLELGSGFNPEFTGRENVYMNAAVLGLSKEETDARFNEIVAFADIEQFIERPVKTYSSGMVVRLAFAVAINVEPQVLVIDEALAVGDAAFQRKCMRRIDELNQSGVTLLFVSHDTDTVKKICNAAIYLSQGAMRNYGSAKDVCIEYERDLFGASKGKNKLNTSNQKLDDEPAQLDPELLASSEKIYGDGRVSILDITLTNKSQQKLNVMNAGMEFVISYRVCFAGFVAKPVFGIMITNREGICIFGTNTADQALYQRDYAPGDELQIKFNLTNNLGPGIYYLTCGVHSGDHADGLVFLQRRMDTLLFKSLGRDGETVGGSAQLYPKIEFSISEAAL